MELLKKDQNKISILPYFYLNLETFSFITYLLKTVPYVIFLEANMTHKKVSKLIRKGKYIKISISRVSCTLNTPMEKVF